MSIRDGINPIALKELRQMVRSRMVSAGLIGYLLVVMSTVAVVLLSSRNELRGGVSIGAQGLGQNVFGAIYFILCGLLLFAMPFYVGFRAGAERSGEHLDLQYTTMLVPRQIVDGKVTASVVLALLFASASLPFLALSYLLRGLDLIQALVATGMLILAAVACIYEALFLAVVSTSRIFRVLIVLWVLSFQSMIVGSVFGVGMALLSSGGFSLARGADLIAPGLFLAGWLSLCLLLRAVILSLVMPSAANRAPGLRGWIAGLWLFWGGIAGVAAGRTSSVTPVMVWCLISVVLFAVFGAFSASTAPGYSRRVLADVAAGRWRRRGQFLRFSGAENGMLWALLCGGATVMVGLGTEALQDLGWKTGINHGPGALQLAGLFCSLTAFVWTLRAAWQCGLHRRLSYRLVGIAALVLMVLGWVLPYLATIGTPQQTAAWYFGNAFAVFDDDLPDLGATVLAAALWAGLAVLANLPGLRAAARRFASLPPPPVAPASLQAADPE